jgi:sulfate transport system substrate-binding protein
VVKRRGTEELAKAYLEYLYSPEGQKLAARHYFRPWDEKAAARPFPKVKLFTVDEVFGGWTKAHETHFKDGGIFDQVTAGR